MKVYHVTSRAAAATIEREGFRDRTGNYLTAGAHCGVWLADSPLGENEGIGVAEAGFEIEIDEASIRNFEWIEEGKPYREWLVPAALLNGAGRRRLRDEEL